jgi:hypothetical protein
MAHLAMQEADAGGQVVSWLDHVTDEECSTRWVLAHASAARDPGEVIERSAC